MKFLSSPIISVSASLVRSRDRASVLKRKHHQFRKGTLVHNYSNNYLCIKSMPDILIAFLRERDLSQIFSSRVPEDEAESVFVELAYVSRHRSSLSCRRKLFPCGADFF